MSTAVQSQAISICLDIGITQTRAWALVSGEIVARARVLEGIRGSILHEDRMPAVNAIQQVVAECLEQIDGDQRGRELDFISAAGMATSELGPYPLSHIQGPAGVKRLSENVARRNFLPGRPLPLFLVPGIRFGSDGDGNASDAIRGEETLVMGMLSAGHLAPGDALLNLGSHWKLIRTNQDSEIIDSLTGIGGELMLAVSRETILKSNLPEDRPLELLEEALKTGRERASLYGLGRTLFLSRMDVQRRGLPAPQVYWQIAGALVEDTLIGLRPKLKGVTRLGISGGYSPLANAWAGALSEIGVESRIFSEAEIESSFCTGLSKIVMPRYRESVAGLA